MNTNLFKGLAALLTFSLFFVTTATAAAPEGLGVSYGASDWTVTNDQTQSPISRGGYAIAIDYQWPIGEYLSFDGRIFTGAQAIGSTQTGTVEYISLQGYEMELRAWYDQFYISSLGGMSMLSGQDSITDMHYMSYVSTYYGYGVGYESPIGIQIAYRWRFGDQNALEGYPDVSFKGGSLLVGFRLDFDTLTELYELPTQSGMEI